MTQAQAYVPGTEGETEVGEGGSLPEATQLESQDLMTRGQALDGLTSATMDPASPRPSALASTPHAFICPSSVFPSLRARVQQGQGQESQRALVSKPTPGAHRPVDVGARQKGSPPSSPACSLALPTIGLPPSGWMPQVTLQTLNKCPDPGPPDLLRPEPEGLTGGERSFPRVSGPGPASSVYLACLVTAWGWGVWGTEGRQQGRAKGWAQ